MKHLATSTPAQQDILLLTFDANTFVLACNVWLSEGMLAADGLWLFVSCPFLRVKLQIIYFKSR